MLMTMKLKRQAARFNQARLESPCILVQGHGDCMKPLPLTSAIHSSLTTWGRGSVSSLLLGIIASSMRIGILDALEQAQCSAGRASQDDSQESFALPRGVVHPKPGQSEASNPR